MEIIKSLWRGDVRLVVTFWGYGVIGTLLMFVSSYILKDIAFDSPTAGAYLTCFGGSVLYATFSSVAIWRSSMKYTGSIWWARLACLSVALGWLSGLTLVLIAFYLLFGSMMID